MLFGDSRMSDKLYMGIKKLNVHNIPFNIERYRGAGLIEVVEKADIYLRSYPFDVVYIIAGVNDIEDRSSGRVSFLWKSEGALTNYLIRTRRNSFKQLKKDHLGAKVVFCPLIGLDLSKAVKGGTDEQQQMIDSAVWEINIDLIKMRKSTDSTSRS